MKRCATVAISGAAHESLLARLQAVARSHDLLLKTEWAGAELGAVVRGQLAPYLGERSYRVRVEGPVVQLPTEAAVPFALLVHELATNALKYGSLSRAKGSVAVSWELIERDEGRHLKMVWREHDGPVVRTPAVIEQGLPDAMVRREFKPDGLICTVALPLSDARSGERK